METPSTLDKQEVITQIKKSTKGEIDTLLKHIITEKLKQEKDPGKLYEFFTYIYDQLYHDIIFKKIHISKQLVNILENLAMPTYTEDTVRQILEKISKI